MNIKTQEIWPQFNLTYHYVTQEVKFKQLSYELYIAGECKTIMQCSDMLETKGRLNLLIRIAYLKQKGHAWSCLREFYAAVVRAIEMHESTWASDWRDIEDMVLGPAPLQPASAQRAQNQRRTTPEVWFCRYYNRVEGCDQQSPHEAQIGRRKRMVRHICAACWNRDKEIKQHSEI